MISIFANKQIFWRVLDQSLDLDLDNNCQTLAGYCDSGICMRTTMIQQTAGF